MNAASSEAMDFRAFVDWSARARRERPNVVSLCETRIERALAGLRPDASNLQSTGVVHRCDLARQWCDLRGVPSFSGRALVCEGVRHALAIIFRSFADRAIRVAIPRDVYPVYLQTAVEARVSFSTFETFPDFDLNGILTICAREHADHVLLPYPLKLHGRSWTEAEIQLAQSWLADDSARRLILDGVYSFGRPLEPAIQQLLTTDQVLYLDSLSKGWLHARVFGTAIVPGRDLERYVESFRSDGPAQSKLHTARQLLSHFDDLPRRLRHELARLRTDLHTRLAQAGLRVRGAPGGYLLAIEGDADELLEGHGLLTIPVSAFGGTSQNVCIASALPPVSDP